MSAFISLVLQVLLRFGVLLMVVAGCKEHSVVPGALDAATEKGGTVQMRIVSLTPSLTRQLIMLGVGTNVVGHPAYCTDCELPNSQLVSTGLTVNAERIAILAPDLVIFDSLMAAKQVALLKKMGLSTHSFEAPRTFEAQLANFEALGKLVGKEVAARHIVSAQRVRLEEVVASIPEPAKSLRMFLQIGANPLYAASGNSFLHEYIRLAGGDNIAMDTGYGAVNREFVLERNPEVIIIATTNQVSEQEKAAWQRYTRVDAVKQDRILVLNTDNACSPTPITFVDTLAQIVAFVYGE